MKETKARRPRGTGCVFQRGDTWWIKYSRHGRQYRESANSPKKETAKNLLKTRLGEIVSGTFVGPQAERVRVEELAEDFLREYRINGRKSIDDVQARWKLHLQPFLGILRAIEVSSELLARYVDFRQREGAKNATINRELAALKRMFHLGMKATPAKVLRLPAFPHLQENNVRKGFLEDAQYRKLVEFCPELWFRSLVECGRTYGWRVSELLNLRVGQVDLAQRVIRLEPGTTKNREGREVVMTETVYNLLSALLHGKGEGDAVFTRDNGRPVKSFRSTWERACVYASVGQVLCMTCTIPMDAKRCSRCKGTETRYSGLIFHDLRRTAARNLRRAGIAEGVIMKIGGWRTRSVFERYAIVNRTDIADAMLKLEHAEEALKSQLSHSAPKMEQEPASTATSRAVN